MPPTVTFKDMEKSMATGQGMGEGEHHSDTATRELMLGRLAELLGKDVRELIAWSDAKFRRKTRNEYKAKFSCDRRKLKRDEVGALFRDAAAAVKRLAETLETADALALADRLGKNAIWSHQADLRQMESWIGKANSVLWKAKDLV